MNAIIKLPEAEREILFRNTAAKCGLSEGIVEKDFWVCWTLDYLFHRSPWTKNLAFKGGTSLSKQKTKQENAMYKILFVCHGSI